LDRHECAQPPSAATHFVDINLANVERARLCRCSWQCQLRGHDTPETGDKWLVRRLANVDFTGPVRH
jgi:hypothetical protein